MDPFDGYVHSPAPTPEEAELLSLLIEECAEVQQRATKALRFGLGEVQPGQPYSNAVRLQHELLDLVFALAMLESAGIIAPELAVEGAVEILEKKRRKLRQLLRFPANRSLVP